MSKKDIKIAAKQTGETAQKISGDMIQVGNIEINTNGYQAGSALETMLGRAQKFKAQQAQNDNTPNGDNGGGGDNTPSSSPTGTVIETPPKGKVEDKETANDDVSNVTPLTFAEVAKAKQLSPERLEEIIDAAENDNLFPTEKLNSQDLIDRVNILRAWVDTEENKLKTAPFSISSYKSRRSVLQARAAYVLLIECYIGEQLKAIPKLKGTNKNSKCRVSGQMRTKTQIIQEDYELSSRQSRDFQHLTWDGVKAAIEIALRRNDIPTRDLALSKSASIKAKQNKSNNKIKHTKFELDNIEETEFKMLQLEKPMYITTLFSNISLGLARIDELNLHCRVAAEWDPTRAQWHERLYPDCHMVQGDFTSDECFNEALEWHNKTHSDIVMASCCCEPFSNLNNSPNKGNVPEAKQFYYAADFILKAKPKYFIMENVPGFVDARPKIAHDILKDKDGKIRCIGQYLRDVLGEEYHLNFGIYTAADYGCVEDRSRLLLLGCRKDISDEPWKFPKRHSVRKMLWEVIGDLISLDNGAIDPDDPWHYARKLPDYLINILEHTPTGCSAWDNDAEYQPLTDKGDYSNGNYNKGFTRVPWQDQCPTITTGNGSISDLCSIHPGRYNPEKQLYTDCRVFSLRELLKIMNCPDNFFDRLNLKREENGMLNETEENNLRKAIGQHFCPDHVNALYSTLPLPANENNNAVDDKAS